MRVFSSPHFPQAKQKSIRLRGLALGLTLLLSLPSFAVHAFDQDLQPLPNPLQTPQQGQGTTPTTGKSSNPKTTKNLSQATKAPAKTELGGTELPQKPQGKEEGSGKKQSNPAGQAAVGPLNLPLGKPLTRGKGIELATPDLSQVNSKQLTIWSITESGEIQPILERESDVTFEPATASKLLTALLCYDRLSHRLNEKVTLLDEDFAGLNGARLAGFSVGETVPIIDLFYGVIIPSGGEAAQALARLAYGSEAEYAAAVQSQIRALGLTHSQFSNSTGLSVPGDQTTTNDLAQILALAASRPHLARMMMTADYTSTPTEQHPEGILMQSILFANVAEAQAADRNKKILIQGGRPGWSPNGGYTLTGFARVGRKLLVIITAGANGAYTRFTDQVNLYSQILGQTHEVTLLQPNEVIATIQLKQGSRSQIDFLNGNDAVTLTLPALLEVSDLEIRKELPASLDAPIKKGEKVGKYAVLLNSTVLYEQDLETTEAYSARALAGLSTGLSQFYNKHPSSYILLFLLLIALILAAILLYEKRDRARRLQAESREREAAETAKREALRAEEEARWEAHKAFTYTTGQETPVRPGTTSKRFRGPF